MTISEAQRRRLIQRQYQRECYLRDRSRRSDEAITIEHRLRMLGHPLHRLLIAVPLGLLAASVVFDVVYLITGNGRWAEVIYWTIAAGIAGGLLAAVPGAIDWLAVPTGVRARGIGLWHATVSLVVLALFGLSWQLRRGTVDEPGILALVLSFAGVVLATISGWLGGELVDRLQVDVDAGSHLDRSVHERAVFAEPDPESRHTAHA
jgi:uncharacterized membrane protein